MPMQKFAPTIDRDVLDRARAVVTALRGQVDECASLNVLVETTLLGAVERLERDHNAGQRFPPVETMPGSGGRR